MNVVLALFVTLSLTTSVDLDAEIVKWSLAYGVDPQLAAAVSWIESYGDPYAVGSASEFGYFQVHPQTAVFIEESIGLLTVQIMNDPATNVRAGIWYLSFMLKRYGYDVELALSAYNGGPKHVDDCGCVYGPTRHYVDKVLAIYDPRPQVSTLICLENGKVCLDEDASAFPAVRAVFRPIVHPATPALYIPARVCQGSVCIEEDAPPPAVGAGFGHLPPAARAGFRSYIPH